MATRKVVFTQNTQAVVTSLRALVDDLIALKEMYTNEDYAAAAADEIVDGDITDCNISAADLHNIFTGVEPAFKNLVTNAAVGAGTYAKYMDRVRSI